MNSIPEIIDFPTSEEAIMESDARKSTTCICGKPKQLDTVVCWHCFKHRKDVIPFKLAGVSYQKWVSTLPEKKEDTPPTTRACDDCGQVTDYSPILVGAIDLLRGLPHFCADCVSRHKREEREDAEKRQRAKQEAAWTDTVPKKYRETETSHPRFQAKLWASLENWPLDHNVGLIGPAGRGKTRLLALLAKRAIESDLFVGWCPATSFQWAAQNQWDDHEGKEAKKWLRRWQSCNVLFLDDLGKHRWTEAVESEFFALIDLRSSRGLPMHWTMNPLPDDEPALVQQLTLDRAQVLGRALDPTGAAAARPRFAPIVSRLMDGTEIIPVL